MLSIEYVTLAGRESLIAEIKDGRWGIAQVYWEEGILVFEPVVVGKGAVQHISVDDLIKVLGEIKDDMISP